MGLSVEEIKEREKSLKRLKITTYKDKKGYVFISYKSDNWREVFEGKVFELQDRGLRVYSDKKFDETNTPWLDDLEVNLQFSSAVLIFISEEYLTSYATLIELLYALTEGKEVVPISLIANPDETLKRLSRNPALVERVSMKPGEGSRLLDFLERLGDDEKYKKKVGRYITKLKDQSFTYVDIVKIFSDIFTTENCKYCYFNLDIDTLEERIRLASQNDKFCPEVFENKEKSYVSNPIETMTLPVKEMEANAPQPERRRGRPPKSQSAQEVKTEAPKQLVQETKAEPSKQPENKKDGVGVGHSATGQLDYELYGKNETGDQGSMMTKVIGTVLEKHPEKIDEAAARFNCLSLEDQMQKNKGDRPSYFRSGQTYEIAGRTVCVGTSYGMDVKLKLIAGIIAMTGEEPSTVLKIDNWPLPEVKSSRRGRSK